MCLSRQLTPRNGRSVNPDNPDGAVRTLAFGSAGMLTYLVLDDEQLSCSTTSSASTY